MDLGESFPAMVVMGLVMAGPPRDGEGEEIREAMECEGDLRARSCSSASFWLA